MPASFLCPPPASTEFYTLSLHDALPICNPSVPPIISWNTSIINGQVSYLHPLSVFIFKCPDMNAFLARAGNYYGQDRKSTRLNSSHVAISYAVFCLKKKPTYTNQP